MMKDNTGMERLKERRRTRRRLWAMGKMELGNRRYVFEEQ
jgi:hypothetical protein